MKITQHARPRQQYRHLNFSRPPPPAATSLGTDHLPADVMLLSIRGEIIEIGVTVPVENKSDEAKLHEDRRRKKAPGLLVG